MPKKSQSIEISEPSPSQSVKIGDNFSPPIEPQDFKTSTPEPKTTEQLSNGVLKNFRGEPIYTSAANSAASLSIPYPSLLEKTNWKEKINPIHLVLFKQYQAEIEEKYKKKFWEIQKELQSGTLSINDIEEKFVLVRLAGWRDLALQREYIGVNYDVYNYTSESVCVKCTIEWKNKAADYGETIKFSSLADANLNNCFKEYANYLSAIAENRSFARAVRNFLNITLVGQDEIGPRAEEVEQTPKKKRLVTNPQLVLLDCVEKVLNITDFELFKEFLREECKKKNVNLSDKDRECLKAANSFESIDSALLCMTLTGFVQSKSS